MSAEQPAGAPQRPTFKNWVGTLWLFTLLRFGMFFALWGILELVGVHGLFAAALGLILSIPLSFVLLAKPRARVAANIEARVNATRAAREDLDSRLDPDPED